MLLEQNYQRFLQKSDSSLQINDIQMVADCLFELISAFGALPIGLLFEEGQKVVKEVRKEVQILELRIIFVFEKGFREQHFVDQCPELSHHRQQRDYSYKGRH